ncbi:MAG TPA: glutamate synthase subunit beta [Stellaceae bacterium]|jgi:glutamate synthase (NADPH/NADH) small chain|nr:glutamate synthase subunit beta [Stellaceae bacterium]
MGKPTGFLEYQRRDRSYEPVDERLKHYREFIRPLSDDELRRQGGRCMDCGTPYCHTGCPVNNLIPDWNDLTFRNDPRAALSALHRTNNFPDFTGRICPAPCEASCTLNLIEDPVTIKTIEHAIIERGWSEGWVEPMVATRRTGKRVAVIGSGPAGLACAQQLARVGHDVAVFEKNARIGGLLRYGIPDFKMEKTVIDRRIAQMRAEGVEFHPNSHVGHNRKMAELMARYDAVVLAIGSEVPRDLPVPGRELAGIHFAMDFLVQQNRRVGGEKVVGPDIMATGKHVLVIGGGDTGSDCIGTSNRHGAKSVTQIEILPMPPEHEDKLQTWPDWPMKLRTSSSHEEGINRDWSVATKAFTGVDGHVAGLSSVRAEWRTSNDGRPLMEELPDSNFEIKADLVLLAMGFVHPVKTGAVAELGLALDPRGNLKADTNNYRASVDKVFGCGDARRGQSLVVWAIREGRQCARAVDEFLMGSSDLPR